MPPVRSMASVKPMKTERTHEENQERAYIAASRRSDRSLEARVESARRASEIHKRRTGRSLRVTEQDVVNEEMYEEEDDDLPMQYRRLTAHLQTQNADFDRRLHAYLTNHVAMRTALGQAVQDAWSTNNQASNPVNNQGHQYQQNAQFMNPGMMQMQQPVYQQPPMMPQPQMYNRSSASYRQTPYPVQSPSGQSMRPNWHNRSASVATPQDAFNYQQQSQPQSAQTSPVEPTKMDDRRISQSAQQSSPHTPQSQQQQVSSPQHLSPVMSRTGSTSNLTTGFKKLSQSPQQMPTPPQQPLQQLQQPRQQPMPSPFYASFDHQMNSGMTPFSMALPMDSQQLLAGSSAFDSNDPITSMFMPPQMPQQHTGMKPEQQRYYSYNPNGKPKNSNNVDNHQTSFNGLSQTLAPGCLDTSVGAMDSNVFINTSQSAATEYFNTPFTPAGLDMGFGTGFGMDSFMPVGSGNTSGQVTPIDEDWANMVHEDMFVSQQSVS
ncbi:hypothetical protein LTR36_007577 [Oleoguttula mirabilis]|uniref:Uncharacterized protein n=1 Tax=Oleoguttula mirabilis TaxID=1507867 RepID=A0AAV9JUZ5_9PEZI|nr:hypothetical protein LTR36_007577 [Oleoguttula mirabilis]